MCGTLVSIGDEQLQELFINVRKHGRSLEALLANSLYYLSFEQISQYCTD